MVGAKAAAAECFLAVVALAARAEEVLADLAAAARAEEDQAEGGRNFEWAEADVEPMNICIVNKNYQME